MFEEKKATWLKEAEALRPKLRHETVKPVSGLPHVALCENDSIVIDFGNHCVGYLMLKLSYEGSHPDAPVWLSIKLCENKRELDEGLENYHGWISKSWVQTEQVHIDVLPTVLRLERRYALRYAKISVMGISSKYRLIIEDSSVDAVTSAADDVAAPLKGSEIDKAIDRTALRTLRS